MSDVIGRGVIEVSADSSKLNASIAEARRSIATLGEASKSAGDKSSASIDRYVKRLETQQKTIGMSSRETELYKLALRGASDEQLRAANATLRLSEAHQRGVEIGETLRTGFIRLGLAAGTGLIAAAVAFDQLVKKAGDFQDIGEKIGDSAENVASLAVAAGTAGVELDSIATFSIKLTKSLTGVDDESKAAGAAIAALGLDLEKFKNLKPADQMEALAKALASFEDGPRKTAVMEGLAKGAAQLMPFLKELGAEGGRQNILSAEQIRLADEYSDRQAKLRAEIGLHAQAIATEMLPAYNDLSGATLDLIKDIAGIKDGVKGLGNSTGIQDFAESAVRALAFVVDAGDGVVRVFQLIGTSIAATAAIQGSVLSGEFRQAASIAEMAQDDINKILNRPFLSQKLDERISARKAGQSSGEFVGPPAPQKKLKFNGPTKDPKSGANQEAKAQLAFDLDQIKKSSEAQINTFANAEKIMEARRAAALLDEREYYAAKLGFIQINSTEQENALQLEIKRLQAEKVAGKDKIDNDRKILDTQAKLAKVRENAAASIEILSIQEVAANDKIAKSYIEATIAAQSYLDTIARQNARAVEGIGRGAKARGEQGERNQIEDKFTGQRQGLERDLRRNQITQQEFDTYLGIAKDTYAKEIALYESRTAAIDAANADWMNGATEAMQNYYDQSRNVAKQTEELFSSAFKGIEQSMADFLFDPFDKGVKGMLQSFGVTIQRMIADAVAADLGRRLAGSLGGGKSGGGIFDMIGGLMGGNSAPPGSSDLGPTMGLFSGLFGRAIGGPVSAGGMYRVNEKGPELLNVAGNQYLMMGNQPGSVDAAPQSGGSVSQTLNFYGPADEKQVRRAAGQGAREALAAFSGAGRYA